MQCGGQTRFLGATWISHRGFSSHFKWSDHNMVKTVGLVADIKATVNAFVISELQLLLMSVLRDILVLGILDTLRLLQWLRLWQTCWSQFELFCQTYIQALWEDHFGFCGHCRSGLVRLLIWADVLWWKQTSHWFFTKLFLDFPCLWSDLCKNCKIVDFANIPFVLKLTGNTITYIIKVAWKKTAFFVLL